MKTLFACPYCFNARLIAAVGPPRDGTPSPRRAFRFAQVMLTMPTLRTASRHGSSSSSSPGRSRKFTSLRRPNRLNADGNRESFYRPTRNENFPEHTNTTSRASTRPARHPEQTTARPIQQRRRRSQQQPFFIVATAMDVFSSKRHAVQLDGDASRPRFRRRNQEIFSLSHSHVAP